MSAPGFSTASSDPNNLIAGDYPRVTEGISVGGARALGLIVDSNGDEVGATYANAYGVIAEATTGAGETVVYLSGEFNERKLSTGGAGTVAAAKSALRAINIYVKPSVAA